MLNRQVVKQFINGELPYVDNLFLSLYRTDSSDIGECTLVNRRYAEAVIERNA